MISPRSLLLCSRVCALKSTTPTHVSRRLLSTLDKDAPNITTTMPATKHSYTKSFTRGDYAKVEQQDIEFFRNVLRPQSEGGGAIITNEDDLKAFNTDWTEKYGGNSKLALRPKTTEQVSKILEYCNKRGLAVVPQGGNTGLVGGGVPVFDEVILSTGLMSQVESFDSSSGVVVCQAGVILENLEKYLWEREFTVPLDLGAKGR